MTPDSEKRFLNDENADNTEPLKKVWVLCFEYAGIIKVGGLGEVSANQSRSIARDPRIKLDVFMPSYGLHEKFAETRGFKPVMEPNGNKLVLRGHFDPSYFGIMTGDMIHARILTKFQSIPNPGYFEIEIWRGTVDGVKINFLVGVNELAKRILNDPEVYGISTLNAKLGLFAHAIREYTRYCIYKEQTLIPDVIHIHDHHPVAALINARQQLNLAGMDVKTIITMHLLTWPRRELEFYWKCGINNEPMKILLGSEVKSLRMRELYELAAAGENSPPTIEKIGCLFADKVLAVSKNFLENDIVPYCGGELIGPKSDFTWNGCDWDYESNRKSVWERVKRYFPGKDESDIQSWDLRNVLLTRILGELPPEEPFIDNDDIKRIIAEQFNQAPYHPDGKVDAFETDGPLVLLTGRVSPQKGIENVFKAIPYVIEKIPNVKFLFLLIPTPYTYDDMLHYISEAKKYPDNVRIIFGITKSIYLLSHLSADVYTCPSRWEPFGIVALEAMASGIPVVATYVGGLQESIIHLEDDPNNGTGLLCPADDVEALKYALVSMLSTMLVAERKKKDPSIDNDELAALLNNIVHPKLKARVSEDPMFGAEIRRNCIRRVESTFRWAKVSEKLKEIYLNL